MKEVRKGISARISKRSAEEKQFVVMESLDHDIS